MRVCVEGLRAITSPSRSLIFTQLWHAPRPEPECDVDEIRVRLLTRLSRTQSAFATECCLLSSPENPSNRIISWLLSLLRRISSQPTHWKLYRDSDSRNRPTGCIAFGHSAQENSTSASSRWLREERAIEEICSRQNKKNQAMGWKKRDHGRLRKDT